MIYQIEKLMIPPTPPTLPTLQVARSGTPLRRAAQRKGLQSKGAGGAWSCRASKGGSVHHLKWGFSTYPDAPCMVYLPTFGRFLGQMLVNIPYMDPMGYQKLERTEKILDDCVKSCYPAW